MAITRDVMRMTQEGMALPQIRAWIDAHYQGSPTHTELP